jgi:hypothetical protein
MVRTRVSGFDALSQFGTVLPQPRGKGFGLSEELQVSMKVELAVLKDAL